MIDPKQGICHLLKLKASSRSGCLWGLGLYWLKAGFSCSKGRRNTLRLDAFCEVDWFYGYDVDVGLIRRLRKKELVGLLGHLRLRCREEIRTWVLLLWVAMAGVSLKSIRCCCPAKFADDLNWDTWGTYPALFSYFSIFRG